MTNKYIICAYVTSNQIKNNHHTETVGRTKQKLNLQNKKFIRVTLIILSENVVSLIRYYNLKKEK